MPELSHGVAIIRTIGCPMTDTLETAPWSVERVPVPGVDARIHVFRCGRLVDTFAVIARQLTVLIDTMVSPECADEVCRLLTTAWPGALRRPLVVCNTHGDWDHAWGNGLFAGELAPRPAPILGSAALRQSIDLSAAEAYLRDMRHRHPGVYDSVRICLPTVEFDGELRMHGGDLTLVLVPTPGHTPDHISVWIPEVSLLIAGDAAEMPIPFVDERSDVAQLRASLRVMLELGPKIVLYSHGGGFTTPDLIRNNIAYFDEAERRCRRWATGSSTSESATPAALGWPLNDAIPAGTSVDEEDESFYVRSHEQAVAAIGAWTRRAVQR